MSKKKRGVLITIVLCLQTIGAVYGMIGYFTNNMVIDMLEKDPALASVYQPLSSTEILVSTITSALILLAIIGVFRWNKKFIYFYVIINLISAIVGIIFDPILGVILSYIIMMIIVVSIARSLIRKIELQEA